MRSDNSVTVTRDTPVTSRVTRTCDIRVTQRVSHATTTTPHHTFIGYLPMHRHSLYGARWSS